MENVLITGITDLAPELIRQIFKDTCISRDDLKSLRLFCRHFTGEATRLLFYRVCISNLKRDRDAFLNVAARPHLAGAVRVLAWYELTEGELGLQPYFNLLYNDRTLTGEDIENPSDFYRDIVAQARDAFWIPTHYLYPRESDIETTPPPKQADVLEMFRPHFYAALDAMNLHTIISQPMDPYRLLTKSLTDYPITVQLLLRDTLNTQPQMNDGFYDLLGPAMARYTTTKPITRLYFADESKDSSLIRLDESFLPAFVHLTHIDLCISRVSNLLGLKNLNACLQAAASLSHLRLCFERSVSYFMPHWEGVGYHAEDEDENKDSLDRKSMFDLLLCDADAHWTKLQSLHLEDLWFPTFSVLRFVRKHASSLRYLRTDSCRLTAGVVLSLAGIPGLRLEQLVVLPTVASEETVSVSETRLLAFVNGGGTDTGLREALSLNATRYIRSHASVFDSDHWSTAAICDSRGRDGFDLGYSTKELDVLDVENGDVRDGENWAYEKGGCWERPFEKGYLETEEEHDEYTREQISHLKRCREAPRWMWGRADDGRGDVYYWVVDSEDGRWAGNLTEIWRFEHRNGKIAFGDDPLEFFEDWEGSEAGDISEPTPFGWEFSTYLLEQKSGQSDPNPWRSVPEERALKYDEDQDPTIGDEFSADANRVGPYDWCDYD